MVTKEQILETLGLAKVQLTKTQMKKLDSLYAKDTNKTRNAITVLVKKKKSSDPKDMAAISTGKLSSHGDEILNKVASKKKKNYV